MIGGDTASPPPVPDRSPYNVSQIGKALWAMTVQLSPILREAKRKAKA